MSKPEDIRAAFMRGHQGGMPLSPTRLNSLHAVNMVVLAPVWGECRLPTPQKTRGCPSSCNHGRWTAGKRPLSTGPNNYSFSK
jgi:hypothetical protein